LRLLPLNDESQDKYLDASACVSQHRKPKVCCVVAQAMVGGGYYVHLYRFFNLLFIKPIVGGNRQLRPPYAWVPL